MAARGKGTDRSIALYCQELIRRAETAGRESKDIAAMAGVSRSLISQIKNKGEGVGFRSAYGLAKAFGMTLSDLFERAEAWAAGGEDVADPSPSRAEAARFARIAGLSEDAVRIVEAIRIQSGYDVPPLDWLERIKKTQASLVHAQNAAREAELHTEGEKAAMAAAEARLADLQRQLAAPRLDLSPDEEVRERMRLGESVSAEQQALAAIQSQLARHRELAALWRQQASVDTILAGAARVVDPHPWYARPHLSPRPPGLAPDDSGTSTT